MWMWPKDPFFRLAFHSVAMFKQPSGWVAGVEYENLFEIGPP